MMNFKIGAAALVASAVAFAGASLAQTPRTITIGTAGPGSIVYVWVTSLSSALENINAPVRIQVNAGVFDTEAMRILEAGGGGLDASFVGGSSLVAAALGRPPFEGERVQNLRGAFPLGQAPVVVVAPAHTGIESIEDLDGKRITAGPTGIGNDVMMRGFLDMVAPDVNYTVVPMPHAAFSSALQDGRVDAVFILGWPPYPAVVETAALMDINYVPFTQEQMETWMAENPQHHTMVLEAGINPQQDEDIVTFGHVSHLIVPERLEEEVMYELTTAYLRDDVREMLLNASSTWEAAFMALESGLYFQDLTNLELKLHPGAARAFDEHGIDVPAAIVE